MANSEEWGRSVMRKMKGKARDDESGHAPFPSGTALSGYSGPEDGPFKCAKCEHFTDPGSCDQETVLDDPDVPHKNGKAVVEPDGCCCYFEKQEEKDKPKDPWFDAE